MVVVRRGGKFVLLSRKKDPKTGKRKRLGTHGSRAGAEAQERAIKLAKLRRRGRI